MRLALISFEYPPAVAIGGIGTYALEAAKMLTKAGVEVEVFAAGAQGAVCCETSGVLVHRVVAKDREELSEKIVPMITRQHGVKAFDVLESPEIGAEGLAVALALPEIARVVKLHTPSYLVGQNGYEPPTIAEQLRFSLGGLRRGRLAFLRHPAYKPEGDRECAFARLADEIAAPSRAIQLLVGHDWKLAGDRISCFPYPLRPDPKLTALTPATEVKTVGFLGRMEARKGIVELTRAIPLMLKQAPWMRFRFIGPSWPYKQGDMQAWMEKHLGRNREFVEFVGAVKPAELPEQLAQCDIVVLPSRWESFGLVCAEAMAAGRAVVGSSAGGMAEMIEHGKTGLLVPPKNPGAIAEAILSLTRRPQLVRQFAEAGRKSIVAQLAPERVLPLQMASYERAIAQCRQRLANRKT